MLRENRDRPPLGAGDDAEVEQRAGDLARVTTQRTIDARCSCGRTFTSTGTAAAHARTSRHTVAVAYAVRFTLGPRQGVAE